MTSPCRQDVLSSGKVVCNLHANEAELRYPPQPALDRIANLGIFDTSGKDTRALKKGLTSGPFWSFTLGLKGKKRYSDLKQQIIGISQNFGAKSP